MPETGKTQRVQNVKWNLGAVDVTNFYDILEEDINESELYVNQELHAVATEYFNVGAGIGGSFDNTSELRVMKYDEVINRPDGEAWKREIKNEHE